MKIRYGRLRPLLEAFTSTLRTPGTVTASAPHLRDGLDIKRVMAIVLLALIPCVAAALYNTGYQANWALEEEIGEEFPEGWRGGIMSLAGIEADCTSSLSNILHGALLFVPLLLVSFAAALFWELLFAVVRRRRVTEALLVTVFMFALIAPPTLPWWQAALGVSFGVVFGKEVFGGMGMNVLNPALVGRAFLFFAYPAGSTGEEVWVAADGISRATPLAELSATGGTEVTWMDAFLGLVPGSMGETSALACFAGAAILAATGIASLRIMISAAAGLAGTAALFNIVGSDTNAMFGVSPLWHLVVGGFAFGAVFMATDPVTSARTGKGQVLYGLLIGALTVLVRVANPAYVEGVMLAILFANVFAPAIDKAVVRQNVRRRRSRGAS